MALNFPNSPTNGQLYTDTLSGNSWTWDSANTCWKSTSTYIQTITVSSSAPGTPAVGQLWWNRDYGRLLVYYNDGDTSQWVDASPSDYTSTLAYNQANAVSIVANNAFANTSGTFNGNLTVSGNVVANKQVTVTYTPATTVNSAITLAAANTQGGTGYADFMKVTNLSGGSTNPNKTFRLNSTGGIEVINSAYSANLLTLDDSGRMLRPYQPMLFATKNNGSGWVNYYNGGSGSVFIYNNAIINVGSSYNTSTGIFTCPVSGYYQVQASILLGYGAGANAFYLQKNGSQYAEGNYDNMYSTSVHTTCSSLWTVNCSTNDTLKIFVVGANATTVYDVGWNALNITLLG